MGVTGFQVKIEGTKELADKLRALPVKIQKGILLNAVTAGAMLVREEARTLVPKKTGNLARAIRVTRFMSGTAVVAKVVVKGRHSFLGKFMEYGVQPHIIRASRKQALSFNGIVVGGKIEHPGISPRPFMRPALDNNVDKITSVVRESLERNLKWDGISSPTVTPDEEGR